jgi:rod shape-determining protein MreD
LWFLGLFFALTKGKLMNLMDVDILDMDLLPIIIAYLFLFYGQTAAATFAFAQGLLIDLLSGGLHGLFTFIYLSIFGCIYLGSRFFNLEYPKGQILLISLVVLLKKILLLLVLSIFSQEIFFPKSFLLVSGISAIGTGLITPIAFYLFNRLRTVFLKEAGNAPAGQL